MPTYTVVEAPSILGLTPSGVEDLPRALKDAGLYAGVGVKRTLRVDAVAYDSRRDPETGILNLPGLAEFTRRLADEVGAVLDRGERPLVLGGDCTILLGNLLALTRRGRYGLLFLDGHADFYQPEANINGQAASSELAFATGRGPAALTRFDGHANLIDDTRVVALGMRDADEASSYGSQPLPTTIRSYDFPTIQKLGAEYVIHEATEYLRGQTLDGLWVHFDADVLDDAIMPAVDYRLPGGVSWNDAESILRGAVKGGNVIGMDITIFNPRMDPDGSIAKAFAAMLARSLVARD